MEDHPSSHFFGKENEIDNLKGEYEVEVQDDQKVDELKVFCSLEVSLSISCHASQFLKMGTKILKPPVGCNSDEVSFHGGYS